jgi:hypothetical protein
MEPEPQRRSSDIAHLVLGVGSGAWLLASWAARPFRRLGEGVLLYVIFPVGLLWSAVSRERRSLQDVVVRSIVVYDR